MFHDIGRKIKAIASGMCWVGMIGICTSVIVFVSGSIGLLTNRTAVVSIGTYCVVAGLLLMLASFFVYGFGELVENSRRIADQLGAGRPRDAGRYSGAAAPAPMPVAAPEWEQGAPVEPASKRTREPRSSRREARQTTNAPAEKSDTWQCPECGMIHPAIRPICLECGEPRPNDVIET